VNNQQWIDFNINQKVRVKLTNKGRAELQRQRDELNRPYVLIGREPPFGGPPFIEDAEGWSEWQLWCLMENLGHLCSIGSSGPFETGIQFLREEPT
jgi:hypothetical protein